jgi:antitoxin HicB
MFVASYPALFLSEQDSKGFHVRFPDLPEALTGGDDLQDTMLQAADCLAEALAGRIVRGDEIPQPSKTKRGQRLIGVPLYLAPKLALYLAMRERRILSQELAKRLGVSEMVVRRMLNPKHPTKSEKIQAALGALGKRHRFPVSVHRDFLIHCRPSFRVSWCVLISAAVQVWLRWSFLTIGALTSICVCSRIIGSRNRYYFR